MVEELGRVHGPREVDVGEEVGSEHRVVWSLFVGATRWEHRRQDCVYNGAVRVDTLWDAKEANQVVLYTRIDRVVDAELLRFTETFDVVNADQLTLQL